MAKFGFNITGLKSLLLKGWLRWVYPQQIVFWVFIALLNANLLVMRLVKDAIAIIIQERPHCFNCRGVAFERQIMKPNRDLPIRMLRPAPRSPLTFVYQKNDSPL